MEYLKSSHASGKLGWWSIYISDYHRMYRESFDVNGEINWEKKKKKCLEREKWGVWEVWGKGETKW